MKKWFFIMMTALLLLPSAAYAAEREAVRIAIIDTGISTAAVSADSIGGGMNYIRPQDRTEDKLGHGTAVSAIIVGSEPARITGLCPTATLIPLVTASKDEAGKQLRGDTAMTAQAIYDAIDVYRCRIINISSGSAAGSERLREAVEYAEKRGVLVVSCAGNSQSDHPGAVYYPGGYESVLSVGAANEDGSIAAFSQRNDTVDLLALGTDLRLASVRGTRIRGEGTSFAAAIVTGAAAQIWTNHPELTAAEVRTKLMAATRMVDGWRVLDLKAALADEQPTVFEDVTVESFCYKPVLWAVEQGVTNGATETTFAPRQTCTQAHVLTFLWRAVGKPESTGNYGYTHAAVRSDKYFYDAFQWAAESGVVTDLSLRPDAPCSRGDVVTYLWRLAGKPNASKPDFADVALDAPYAQAVGWAAERGITNGATATEFQAQNSCNRGQIVTFLYRYFVA